MIILPEIKKIAGAVARIDRLSDRLNKETDLTGVWWNGAYLVSGCTEKRGHLYQDGCRLDNCGLVDDLYYCDQHTGYCEDDFHGTLYFKTNVPGQFVAVPFEM